VRAHLIALLFGEGDAALETSASTNAFSVGFAATAARLTYT
jgi:hypothetical protein